MSSNISIPLIFDTQPYYNHLQGTQAADSSTTLTVDSTYKDRIETAPTAEESILRILEDM